MTENAAEGNETGVGLPVQVGRLTHQDITRFNPRQKDFKLLLMQVILLRKKHLKMLFQVQQEANVPYIRYERESQTFTNMKNDMVENYEEAAEVAATKRRASSC